MDETVGCRLEPFASDGIDGQRRCDGRVGRVCGAVKRHGGAFPVMREQGVVLRWRAGGQSSNEAESAS